MIHAALSAMFHMTGQQTFFFRSQVIPDVQMNQMSCVRTFHSGIPYSAINTQNRISITHPMQLVPGSCVVLDAPTIP
jgi:hypothetical protein